MNTGQQGGTAPKVVQKKRGIEDVLTWLAVTALIVVIPVIAAVVLRQSTPWLIFAMEIISAIILSVVVYNVHKKPTQGRFSYLITWITATIIMLAIGLLIQAFMPWIRIWWYVGCTMTSSILIFFAPKKRS
jgi:NADH:ubiquinone oxidoreductase subunit K